jgi:hypothetical protein
MSFNKGFTKVNLLKDGVLTVHGTSDQVVSPDDEIHVTILSPRGGELRTERLPPGKATTRWEVSFPDAAAAFDVDDDVFVVGVAIRPAPCDPFVWDGSFTITAG